MPDKINGIPEKIKRYRKIKNMSQEMLALASGINISMIKKYECGIRNPKPEQLLKIANALGISINALYSHEINTVSDVVTLLINLDEQTALNIAGEKDESGKYIPGSIYLSFDDDKINDALTRYLAYKDGIISISQTQERYESITTETTQQLTDLITLDAIIKRSGSH